MKNLAKITSDDAGADTRRTIIDVAEQLFSQVGFQKTTVADIAARLHMSAANVYRFFSSKAEINEAVARSLLAQTEAAVLGIARRPLSASQKLRACVAAIESANAERKSTTPKLHGLVEAAFNENWPALENHVQAIDISLSDIIGQGNRDGEFRVGDCDLAAAIVRSACIRFFHPRLMAELANDAEPTLDQMIDFCVAALSEKNSLPPAAPISGLSNSEKSRQ